MNDFTVQPQPAANRPVAVITGGNTGLGFETAKALSRHGYHVVLACRDTQKGGAAAKRLVAADQGGDIQVASLDLASDDSVRRFSHHFLKRHTRLDRLINNAGIMAVPYALTDTGYELQYGVNHLGHFLLTHQLMPALQQSPGARVVTVTSLAARMAKPRQLLSPARRYDKWNAYSISKMANLMFGLELHDRMRRHGLSVKSVLAHPGFSRTHLQNALLQSHKQTERLTGKALLALCQPAAQGALPIIHAALSDTVRSGDFYGPSGFLQIKGLPKKVQLPSSAYNPSLRSTFWTLSERQTRTSYADIWKK